MRVEDGADGLRPPSATACRRRRRCWRRVRPGASAAKCRAPPDKPRRSALVDAAMPDVAVEVAIRAFGAAERPMHVNPEVGSAHRHSARQASDFSKARARCEIAFFCTGSISPKVSAIAVRHEDRIIAETARPARRPDDRAEDLAFERLRLAVGRGKRQRADEIGASGRLAPLRLELAIDALHGEAEVPVRLRPSAPSGCRARRQAP